MRRKSPKPANLELVLVEASGTGGHPVRQDFVDWVLLALGGRQPVEIGVRIVSAGESAELNQRYRGEKGPTNVLSFPADLPEELDLPLLGDIVICADLVRREARDQGRPERDHWAHLVIHGVLHLLGYDHETEEKAAVMESREAELLASIGIPDPYC